MKVEYHPLTASDLNTAAAFYNDNRPGLGDEFRAEVYSAIARVRANPNQFHVVTDEKRRCRVTASRTQLSFASLVQKPSGFLSFAIIASA